MKTLSLTILTAFVLNPLFVFAGGSGGGGVLMGMSAKTPEIVFHMGQKADSIKFAYGHLEGSKWQIESHEIPRNAVYSDKNLSKALESSRITNSWVEIN